MWPTWCWREVSSVKCQAKRLTRLRCTSTADRGRCTGAYLLRYIDIIISSWASGLCRATVDQLVFRRDAVISGYQKSVSDAKVNVDINHVLYLWPCLPTFS